MMKLSDSAKNFCLAISPTVQAHRKDLARWLDSCTARLPHDICTSGSL